MCLSLFTHYIKNWMLGALNRDGVEVMDIWWWIYDIWIYGCGYTIIDICLWTYDYRYMVTMYSYFENRWTEPIQDNLDVIDMCYGYMLKNMIRQFLHKLECKIWIDILYSEIKTAMKIFQSIPQCSWILLKGNILQQSWIQNMNRYILCFEVEMVMKIFQIIPEYPEYYWTILSLHKAEYKI